MKAKVCEILKLNTALLVVCGLLTGQALWAQPNPNDPIGEHFFPPELLQQTHELIGLTEDQKTTLKAEIEKVQDRLAELQEQLKKEQEATAALVRKERLEEPAVLGQVDKVLKLESQIKRTQLALLIRIKNTLTVAQQAQLKEIRAKLAVVQAKLQNVRQAAQQWEKEGRDLSRLEPFKDELEPLLREGKFKEAEAVLNRALKILEGKEQK